MRQRGLLLKILRERESEDIKAKTKSHKHAQAYSPLKIKLLRIGGSRGDGTASTRFQTDEPTESMILVAIGGCGFTSLFVRVYKCADIQIPLCFTTSHLYFFLRIKKLTIHYTYTSCQTYVDILVCWQKIKTSIKSAVKNTT